MITDLVASLIASADMQGRPVHWYRIEKSCTSDLEAGEALNELLDRGIEIRGRVPHWVVSEARRLQLQAK